MNNNEALRHERLIQIELESIQKCDFSSELDTILDLAKELRLIVGTQNVVTLGKSYSVSDAFLQRANLSRSQSQSPELNSLLYKNQTPDWSMLMEAKKMLPQEPFVIIDEFSFSGTKILTTVVRLLRLGITNFQFIALVGPEEITTRDHVNQVVRFLNPEDREFFDENIEEVLSKIGVLKRKKTLLKKLGIFTNIVSSYQAELNKGEIPVDSIYYDKRVVTSIARKLSEITGRTF